MEKTNRSFFIIAIVIVIAIIAIWLTLVNLHKRSADYTTDMYSLIPSDAYAIIHIKDVPEFLQEFEDEGSTNSLLIENLWGNKNIGYKSLVDSIKTLDSVSLSLISESQLLASIHKRTASKNIWLFQFKFKNKITDENISNLISEFLNITNSSSYNYLDNKIHIFSSRYHKEIHWSIFKGHLLISYYKKIIEQSITQHSTKRGIDKNAQLSALRQTAGAYSNNLFIDFQKFSNANFKDVTHKSLPFGIFSNLAGWAAYDIISSDNYLSLNGYLSQNASEDCFISVLNNANKFDEVIFDLIPARTNLINIIGIDEMPAFEDKLKNYYAESEFLVSYMKTKFAWEENTGIEPKQLQKLTGKTIGYGFAENSETNKYFDFAIISLKNPQELISLISNLSEKDSINNRESVHDSKIFKYDQLSELINIISAGLIVSDFSNSVIKDSFLIATKSNADLKFYLNKLNYGQTILSNKRFASFYNTFNQNSNYVFFSDFPLTKNQSEKLFLSENSAISEKDEFLKFAGTLGIDMIQHRDGIFHNVITLKENSKGNALTGASWETNLDTTINVGPHTVINHNDNSKEFILQDNSNNLYLINKKGAILWKKQISGPIISDIFQIDIYKNKKLQYLFNTRNYLHLIDRNGNYVNGFPSKLLEPASAGLALFDYEKDKNYRILVPSENKQIHNYAKTGKPVSGWIKFSTNDTVFCSPQHHRIDGKDYLFFKDKNGNLYITNRRGQKRINVPKSITLSKNALVYKGKRDNKSLFVSSGKNGELIEVFPDGESNSFITDSLSNNPYFLYGHFSNNENPDYIFTDNNKLLIYNSIGEKLLEKTIPEASKLILDKLTRINKEVYIQLYDKKNSRLYLINNKGQIVIPFPMKGDTKFTIEQIDNNDSYFIIFGYQNKIKSYLFHQ